MDLRPHSDGDRRHGHERRTRNGLHYRYCGPERRSGLDRRSAALGVRPAYLESFAGAHRLVPAKDHHFLSPLVVAMRLASEFAYVEADEAEGLRHVWEIMKQLDAKNNRHRDSLLAERLKHLDQVKERAVHVCFGDDPGGETEYLCTVVIPGEPLIFEYESAAHERAVRPLLRRCAQMLGYDILDGVADDSGGHLFVSAEQRAA